MPKYCVLEDNKICDNCMKCLQTGADYNAIEIDEIIDEGCDSEEYERLRRDLADTSEDEQPYDCFKPDSSDASGER